MVLLFQRLCIQPWVCVCVVVAWVCIGLLMVVALYIKRGKPFFVINGVVVSRVHQFSLPPTTVHAIVVSPRFSRVLLPYAQIRIWKHVLIAVTLDASWWHW